MRAARHWIRALRPLHTPGRSLGTTAPTAPTPIRVVFVDKDGAEAEAFGREGQSILQLAHDNDVELEGACDGSLACSTCHVVLEQATYDALPAPCIEEEDMLDLAFGLTQTSRLGCQVKLARALDGMRVTLPHATRNMAVDGFKPKPH